MKKVLSKAENRKMSISRFLFSFLSLGLINAFLISSTAQAYPIFAQQNYANPREATGRIVCANCHLAQKPVDLEIPQAVLPAGYGF